MKEIAYRDWYRYSHAEFNNGMALPFFQMQATLDVTKFRGHAKSQGISFYFGLIWVTMQVIRAREDFRWRLRGDRVVLIDDPEPSFTDLMAGTELYKIVHAGTAGEDMVEYARRARAVADAQTEYFPSLAEEVRDDYIYFSSLPMVTFTQMTQAMNTDKDNFIPAIAWAKYWEENGRTLLPYTIGCNHRAVDGFHVARLFVDLQEALDALD